MHFLSCMSIGIVLSSSLVAGHLRHNQRRYANATVVPTSCDGTATRTPTTKKCPITGLPNSIDASITYPASTTATTWRTPPVDANWQIILEQSINYTFPTVIVDNVKVYDIDIDSSSDTFASWKAAKELAQNSDMYLICYFSAGTSEAARDDIGCFNTQPGAQDYGCNYGGNSPDEFWLNTTSREVRRIMLRRLDQAAQLGCDAVDPDNMDGYSNNNGIGETVADAADYMWFLIQEAHHRGLGIGLKNSDDLAMNKTLTDQLDFAVVEECFTSLTDNGDGTFSNSCSNWGAFYKNSTKPKPVYNIEYPVVPAVSAKPQDRSPWSNELASSRCAAWATETSSQYLKVDLKNYYTVDCGVARCSTGGPSPALTTTDATYTTVCSSTTAFSTTTVALVTPAGCTQSPVPTSVNCNES